MGVAALVLGICALVLGIFGLGFPIGTICGIVGIIFGVIGRKQHPENAGLATGGMVCSIIGTILSLLLFFACAACVGGTAGLGSLLS